jgi:alkaline phosphatase
MSRRLAHLLLPVAMLSTATACRSQAARSEPTRVILFLADGTGVAQWSAGLLGAGELAIESFPVLGLVDTRNAHGRITDSGASATAYATGVLTYNRAIGVGPDSVPLVSVCDVAHERGMSTGLVATSSVVHATPASFIAKMTSRYEYEALAAQMAGSLLSVLLGGGRQFFDGASRSDRADLLGAVRRRHVYVEDEEALLALDPDTVGSLVGLFAPDEMPPAPQRFPSLSSMTEVALEVLDKDGDGFFLMAEGSQIDWRGHDRVSAEELIAEVLDLDAAIRVALAFAERRPGTLIVVTADHETGGLALVGEDSGVETADGGFRVGASWATGSHTAELVPLFATGPGAERFGGVLTNAEVGARLLRFVSGSANGN